MQTAVVFEQHLGLTRTVCVYGGVPKPEQKAQLRAPVDAIVATPGRLLDFMEEGVIGLEHASCVAHVFRAGKRRLSLTARCRQTSYVVLDEADRMLDMGFERDIKKILAACTYADRQTLMFSATWPVEVQAIAASFQRP